MMRYYIIWFIDNDGEKDYENYVIVQADSLDDANRMALEIAGDYVISVEPHNP